MVIYLFSDINQLISHLASSKLHTMKKLAYVFIAVFALGLLGLTSCSQNHACAAYGSTYQAGGYNK